MQENQGLQMKYFVIKPKSKEPNDPYARAARMAMRTYAEWIEEFNLSMATSLREWAESEEDK